MSHADDKVRRGGRWGRGKDLSIDFIHDEQVSPGIRAHGEYASSCR